MNNFLFSFEMLQAIAIANPGGFTVNKDTLQPIKHGFSVAVKETQNSFGNYGAAKVIKYAKDHNEVQALGGWKNSENGKFYFDAVIICDSLNEAIKLGHENKQIAIFNLDTLEEIKL